MPDDITFETIDELIDYWRRECQDIEPTNVDSMDRGNPIHDITARKAICLLPAVLEELKAYMVREREGQATELSEAAHCESRKWLSKLAFWQS